MKTSCKECGSSDACEIYEDGHSYCFSCKHYEKSHDDIHVRPVDSVVHLPHTLEDISNYRTYDISSRKISRSIAEFFGVTMSVTEQGQPDSHFYPYTKNGEVVAYKQRRLPKTFSVIGDFKGVELFGQSKFAPGGKKLIITEGELDALSVAQATHERYKKVYPVVSIPSASQYKVLLEQREFISSFSEIILAFDNDAAGQAAVDSVAKLLPSGKVKVCRFSEKDASEELCKQGFHAVLQAIWNAQTWCPAGIITGEKIWEEFQARQSVESIPYPSCMDGINEKLKGLRYGEITLFTSGTGSGKSTVVKEIILNLLATNNSKVGLISLEESVGDTAEKFISMALRRPVMDPPPLDTEDLRRGFEEVFGDERLVLLDHQGSVSDDSLLDKIEYMAQMGCRFLFLDHITIAVSEGSDRLTGNEAVDKVMSDLLKITKRYNIWLGLISHLRKSLSGKSFEEGNLASIDDIKGSGSIKQISFDIIAFARNLVAESEEERNTISFRVLKSRFTGLTGDAGSAYYDQRTTRLRQVGGFSIEI